MATTSERKQLGDLSINPTVSKPDAKLSLDLESIKSRDPQASIAGKLYRKTYLVGSMKAISENLANAVENEEWGRAKEMVRQLKENGILKEE